MAKQKITFKEQIDNLIKLRDLYFVGSKLPDDWYEAYNSWLPLADAGDAKAQVNVGYCCQHGHGADKSIDQAIAYYKKAADQNDPRACYCLYQIYESTQKDVEHAKRYLEQAYELKEGRAIFVKIKSMAEKALENGERDKAIEYWHEVVNSSATPYQIEYAQAAIIGLSLKIQSVVVGSLKKNSSTSQGGTIQGTTQHYTTVSYDCPVEVTLDNPTEFSCHSISLIESSTGVSLFLCGKSMKSGVQTVACSFFGGSNGEHKEWAGKHLEMDVVALVSSPYVSSPYGGAILDNPLGKVRIKLPAPVHINTPSVGGCFVLTACYGSADAPTVYAFRQFRDNHLTRHSVGRHFIDLYYEYGPAWAERIATKQHTKAVLRSVFNLMAKILPK